MDYRRTLSLVIGLALAVTAAAWLAGPSAEEPPEFERAAEKNRVGQSAAQLYKRAQSKIDAQKYDEARTLLDKALKKYPESGVFVSGVMTEPYYPHYLMGVAHMEQEEYQLAIQQFQLEQEQGQVQYDAEIHEALTLRLARARRTDNENPVIRTAAAEVVETVFEGEREVADVRFRGVVVDQGGVSSLTIDGREIQFRQSEEGYTFDETLRLDPVPPDVPMVVADIAGNVSRQTVTVDLPPLMLGEAVRDVHAVIVGVNHYRRWTDEPGTCPEEANTCGDPSKFSCYNLLDLRAAAQDAERVYDFLLRRGVPRENMTLLVSREESQQEATMAKVSAALEAIQSAKGSTGIFYFAGHGVNSKRQKNLLLLSDTRQWECGDTPEGTATALEETAIGVDTVEAALMQAEFEERYVILDACRTPRMVSSRNLETTAPQAAGFSARGMRLVTDAVEEEGTELEPVVFYATFDKSVSVEWNLKQAGYFTWYLLQGMRRDLPLWELKTYVQDQVQARTQADHGLMQKPHVTLPERLENDYALQKTTRILGGAERGD